MKTSMTILAFVLAIGITAWQMCFPGRNAPTTAPALLAQWEEAVYSLDPDESIRFIPPPFTPQRSTRFIASRFLGAQRPQMRVMFRVIGGKVAYTAASTGTGSSSYTLFQIPDEGIRRRSRLGYYSRQ